MASDLGVHPKTLRAWVRQDEADDGKLEHSQIDFILVSRGLAERIAYVAIAHTTPAGQVSDHWPIVLDLSTPSEVASATP